MVSTKDHREGFRNAKAAVVLVFACVGVLFALNSTSWAGGGTGVAGGASAPAADTARPKAALPPGYAMPFGDNPFLPSNASTVSGGLIEGSKFIASARCATCHANTHADWMESAHRNAFREPFYQANVKAIISQKGIEYTRHCESCHNPAALFSGALTKGSKVPRPFDDEGVSCVACHSIQSATGHGVGGYVMDEPALLVRADGTRVPDATDQDVLADVASHKRAMMRPLLKTPEFCGACHKSQVPNQLNDYKFIRAFAVADELQMSSFSKQSPQPFYKRDAESCRSCHMKPEKALKLDMAEKDGMIVSHRWAAANTAIPYFYNFKDQLDAATKFLENDAVGVDVFAIWKHEPGLPAERVAPINRSTFSIAGGERLTADVVITNKNIGHSFPPELRDFYEAFVSFTVTDDAGAVVYQSGFIKPDGQLDGSAHAYKTFLVNKDGKFIDHHEIWNIRSIAHNLNIQSGRSDVARFEFTIPQTATGAIHLKAQVRYRRFNRVFSDYALKKSVDFPIVTMATSERALAIGANQPAPVDKAAMPDWKRWNNYGIALLDARQYELALEAFRNADALDEAYRPMARINQAIALFELDRYDDALALLNPVLEADPANARARFQHGRIMVKRGDLATALDDYKKVLDAFPRDRVTLQALGEVCKQTHDVQGALHCFESILAIDPEDTGAHYNLMLIYKKLGRVDDAKREAKIFADQKDDPNNQPVASEFLKTHPFMSSETVPFHVHGATAQR